jgi:pyruvate, water dikinase
MPLSNIAWFKDVDRDDISLVGGKGANLGEMVRVGFPVPNGFIVTAQAYYRFIAQNNLEQKISHLLSTLNHDNPNSLKQISEHIQNGYLHSI